MFKITNTILSIASCIISFIAIILTSEIICILTGFGDKTTIRCKFCNKFFKNYAYYLTHTIHCHCDEIK